MPYGVEQQRGKEQPDPVAPIDRQRMYLGRGGDLSMGATPRRKTQSKSLSSTRPGAFQNRRKGRF